MFLAKEPVPYHLSLSASHVRETKTAQVVGKLRRLQWTGNTSFSGKEFVKAGLILRTVR
jgi:hypothetical protein